MVGTGVPKFVSKKWIGYLLGVAVIVVALVVAFKYIKAEFGEYVEPVKKGEKARFMRYMSCAVAMCAAPNRKNDADGCTDDKVMELGVEYDEGGNPVKGCQEICEEVKATAGGTLQKHYCDKNYAINFTFRDSVKYIGNHSIKGILKGEIPEVSCGLGKTGWQTDVSCLYVWKDRFIDCPCFNCNSIDALLEGYTVPVDIKRYPEGTLLGSSGCYEEGEVSGGIWVSPGVATDANCDPEGHNVPTIGFSSCTFNEGQEIHLWAKSFEVWGLCYYIPLWSDWLDQYEECFTPPSHLCSQIILCDSQP